MSLTDIRDVSLKPVRLVSPYSLRDYCHSSPAQILIAYAHVFILPNPILCRHLEPDPDQTLDLPSIQSHRWLVQPCSAYTGDKLVDGLAWLVQDVADRVYYSSPAIPVEEKEKDVVAAKINTAGNLTA